MTDGGAIVMLVEGDVKNVWANGMEFAEEGRQAGSGFMGRFRGDSVELAAITGGEDEGFFEEAAGAEFRGGTPSLVGGERDALAELEWSGAVI
jgi:hypothetical protein